jgi:hypothetical protein
MKKWKRDEWRRTKDFWQRRKKKVIRAYFHLFYLKLNGIFRFKNKNQ